MDYWHPLDTVLRAVSSVKRKEKASTLWDILALMKQEGRVHGGTHLAHLYEMDCNPPGSSSMGILQARRLEWAAVPSSRGSSQPRDQSQVSHIASGLFSLWATREAQEYSVVPSPGDLPDPGIKLGSPELQADSLPAELPEKLVREALGRWYGMSTFHKKDSLHSSFKKCLVFKRSVLCLFFHCLSIFYFQDPSQGSAFPKYIEWLKTYSLAAELWIQIPTPLWPAVWHWASSFTPCISFFFSPKQE